MASVFSAIDMPSASCRLGGHDLLPTHRAPDSASVGYNQHAVSGNHYIANQVSRDGPIDIVFVQG
jgi:hypothetical protein